MRPIESRVPRQHSATNRRTTASYVTKRVTASRRRSRTLVTRTAIAQILSGSLIPTKYRDQASGGSASRSTSSTGALMRMVSLACTRTSFTTEPMAPGTASPRSPRRGMAPYSSAL